MHTRQHTPWLLLLRLAAALQPVCMSFRLLGELLFSITCPRAAVQPQGPTGMSAGIKVVQGKPAKLEHEPEDEEVSLLAGHMQEDVSTTNQKPLLLGLLKV